MAPHGHTSPSAAQLDAIRASVEEADLSGALVQLEALVKSGYAPASLADELSVCKGRLAHLEGQIRKRRITTENELIEYSKITEQILTLLGSCIKPPDAVVPPPDAAKLILLHYQSAQQWVEAITLRLGNHGVQASRVPLSVDGSGSNLDALESEMFSACAICVDSQASSASLRVTLEQARSRVVNPPRVFPLLLPGALDSLVTELWPQWDWIDFRPAEFHESSFMHLVGAALGNSPYREVVTPTVGPQVRRLSDYERRFHSLKGLRSAGLEEEIYMEAQRKIIDRWMDDPDWDKP